MTEKRECRRHGEYDAEVIEIYGMRITCPCPICGKEIEEEEAKAAQEEKKRQCSERLIKRGIEPEFFAATIENYRPESDSEREAKKACEELLNGTIRKLLLLGSNGTGKTHLACAVAKQTGGTVTTMYEISARIRRGYNNGESELDVLDALLRYPFIAIDEVGRTKGSDSERNWLSYVINKAHVRGISLLLISNRRLARSLPNDRKGESFEYYVDNDVISRFKQQSKIIEVTGRDRRHTMAAAMPAV